jgi:[ribosomal protein S5]-alanine N-acetyltransferase
VELETERLVLRPLRIDDLDALAAFYADPEVMRFIGAGGPVGRNDAKTSLAWMIRVFELDGFGQLAVTRKEDGIFIGRCGLLVWQTDGWQSTSRAEGKGDTELEVGYTLGRPYWGRGYATEAATAVRDFALTELGATRLIALIRPGNVASERVAEKLGMRYEREIELKGAPAKLYALGKAPAR